MVSIDAIRQFVRAHPGKVLLVAIAAILYVAFNVWFYFFTISGGLKTNPVGNITEKIKNFGALAPTPPAKQDPAPRDTPTPIPTPIPTGPGDYACDPYGQCNLYSDEIRKQYCTQTFADSGCLGACADPVKRCKK